VSYIWHVFGLEIDCSWLPATWPWSWTCVRYLLLVWCFICFIVIDVVVVKTENSTFCAIMRSKIHEATEADWSFWDISAIQWDKSHSDPHLQFDWWGSQSGHPERITAHSAQATEPGRQGGQLIPLNCSTRRRNQCKMPLYLMHILRKYPTIWQNKSSVGQTTESFWWLCPQTPTGALPLHPR